MDFEIIGPGPKSMDLKPLGWFLDEHLSNISKDARFFVAVALSDLEGISVLGKRLTELKRKGAIVKVVVGIDLGMSVGALKQIRKLVGNNNFYIYHNPKDSSFHPKFYLIKMSDKSAIVIVGSSNLTHEGLLGNFELNLALKLDLRKRLDRKLLKDFSKKFDDLLRQKSMLLVTNELESKLQKFIRPPTKPRLSRGLARLFTGEAHGWEKSELDHKSTFLMTLSYNDVSGARVADKYIRIPVVAVNSNKEFWGWKKPIKAVKRGKNPERMIKITYKGKNFETRMYFVKRVDEFRLVMPDIYMLGKKYARSIIKFVKDEYTYQVELIPKWRKEYHRYLPLCTEKSPKGRAKIHKMWGYV